MGMAGSASATWSILLVDLSTGEIAVGSATCLTGFDLQANTPVLIPGVGAATAQSFVDVNGFNRSLIRDRLIESVAPAAILDELGVFDATHQTRQYGMVDVLGNAETFSGLGAGAWAGGTTGVLEGAGVTGGDVLFAIQGNVLWGPGVVDDAVNAVRDAPGDLPAKLLAGMQAARDAGGDGRCSCLPNNADACDGQDPAGAKSSDIAYMLVARAGDREGCSPIYRLGSPPADVEPLGDESFVVSFTGITGLDVVTPGSVGSPPTLGSVQRIDAGVDLRNIATGDLNGDGAADIVGAAVGGGVWLLLSDAGEPSGFGPAEPVSATGTDVAIAAGEILIADASRSALVRLSAIGGGAFVESDVLAVSSPPVAITAARLFVSDRDGAAVLSEDGTVTAFEFEAGLGLRERYAMLSAVPNASIIAGADTDRDGAAEILVAARTSELLEVLDGPTGAQRSLIPAPSRVRDIAALDTPDGTGVLVLGASSSAILEPLFPGGPVIYDEPIPIRQQPVGVLPRDLDGDGDTDLAVIGSSGQALRYVDSVNGAFPVTQGCGDGDFFMEFNIAFSERSDPDPVDQLEGLFAAWADDLVGVPDAVRSVVTPAGPFASSIDGCPTRVRVELRDRDGAAADASSLTVELVSGAAGLLTVGDVESLGGGVFAFDVFGAGARGVAGLVITANDGGRAVRLMPQLDLVVDDPADVDGDGDRDADDLSSWIAAFQAGDLAADQNLDGRVTPADYNAWILNRNRACD